MNLREAAQLALEALKLSIPKPRPADDDYAEIGWKEHNAAITALRAALAEPEQKPVGRVTGWHGGHCVIELLNPALVLPDNTALYTAPTPRKPLTDEQIDRVTDQQWAQNNHKPIYAAHRAYARAIERAHGIGDSNGS